VTSISNNAAQDIQRPRAPRTSPHPPWPAARALSPAAAGQARAPVHPRGGRLRRPDVSLSTPEAIPDLARSRRGRNRFLSSGASAGRLKLPVVGAVAPRWKWPTGRSRADTRRVQRTRRGRDMYPKARRFVGAGGALLAPSAPERCDLAWIHRVTSPPIGGFSFRFRRRRSRVGRCGARPRGSCGCAHRQRRPWSAARRVRRGPIRSRRP
jgi:hypothetical protein